MGKLQAIYLNCHLALPWSGQCFVTTPGPLRPLHLQQDGNLDGPTKTLVQWMQFTLSNLLHHYYASSKQKTLVPWVFLESWRFARKPLCKFASKFRMDNLGRPNVGQNSENQQSDPQHPLSFCIILEILCMLSEKKFGTQWSLQNSLWSTFRLLGWSKSSILRQSKPKLNAIFVIHGLVIWLQRMVGSREQRWACNDLHEIAPSCRMRKNIFFLSCLLPTDSRERGVECAGRQEVQARNRWSYVRSPRG